MLKGKKPALASLALLILLVSILSGFCFVSARSANTHSQQWEQYYGDDHSYVGDTIKFVIQTNDGGYAFAAPNTHYSSLRIPSSILIFKINRLGIVQWQKQFNGLATVAGFMQTSDGGYVFAGSTDDVLPGTQGNIELIKLNSQGSIQWNQTFQVAGDSSSMVQTKDGGFALVELDEAYLGTPCKYVVYKN
jgi:hypothetical protein